MNDYSKYDFYKETNKESGQAKFYLKVKNEWIEVDKEVYYVCFNSYRKELRDITSSIKYGVLSLDSTNNDEVALIDKIGVEEDVVEKLTRESQVNKLLEIIHSLNEEERNLIIDLLIHQKKEQELADKYQVARQSINKRKQKIIKKIKKSMKSGCEK